MYEIMQDFNKIFIVGMYFFKDIYIFCYWLYQYQFDIQMKEGSKRVLLFFFRKKNSVWVSKIRDDFEW